MRSLVRSALAVLCLSAFAVAADEPATPAPADTATPEVEVAYVTLSTSMGDILIALNETKAPISSANFLSYVDDKHYDGTIFHRVIDGFMIQGGGMTADMKEKPTKAPIKNEWQNGLKNNRGTIAMARTAAPDSATSQIFINVVDNPMLDVPRGGAAYAVFGEVVAGMDVVDAIRVVKTGDKPPHQNVPIEAITIVAATRTDDAKAQELIAADAAKQKPAQ